MKKYTRNTTRRKLFLRREILRNLAGGLARYGEGESSFCTDYPTLNAFQCRSCKPTCDMGPTSNC